MVSDLEEGCQEILPLAKEVAVVPHGPYMTDRWNPKGPCSYMVDLGRYLGLKMAQVTAVGDRVECFQQSEAPQVGPV